MIAGERDVRTRTPLPAQLVEQLRRRLAATAGARRDAWRGLVEALEASPVGAAALRRWLAATVLEGNARRELDAAADMHAGR